jgi:hypothetical protein
MPHDDGEQSGFQIAVSSASPVIIPGSAIGNSSSSETAFLPKNVLRHSALQPACQEQ